MYVKFFKRFLDIILSFLALIILSPMLLVLTVTGTAAMRGNPFFVQERPGKNEKIFKLIKFRTMSNLKDENGELLPDEQRLNKYGIWLRKTSCDELLEIINILKGDMSIVGPRPQLVRDMVFMTVEQRKRHTVRPGLTGLAQVNGRNSIGWDDRLSWDLKYIEKITFFGDVKITLKTAISVFRHEGINEDNSVTSVDLGDYLLECGKVEKTAYDKKQVEAKELIGIAGMKM
ncbi:MAG: sugar transferase [Eubacterium sp.]|nr:sugar transferase [Eubacterium sp.]